MKRCLAVCVGAALLLALTSCGTQTEPSSSGQGGESQTKEQSLMIPEFSRFYQELKNTAYRLTVQEEGGEEQEITPYTVKINPNLSQNVQLTDPARENAMISFEMGSKPVTVRIRRTEGGAIQSAQVHPLSRGTEATVADGEASFTLTEPGSLCVRLDGDRYDMVYVFAGEAGQVPAGDKVTVIKPGLKTCPRVGTEVWAGGLRDVRTYDSALAAGEITALSGGGSVPGYSNRWALEADCSNEKNPAEQASVYGTAQVVPDYAGTGRSALVMNGYEDCVMAGSYALDRDFTVSAWAYLDPDKTGASRTILNHLLFVRSDGRVGSNIGDWQFPYVSAIPFTPGAWHHVALVKRGNAVTVYIDGVSGGTQERPPETGSTYIILGSGAPNSGLYVKEGETLYISPGAVVRGTIYLYGTKNAAVRGGGIIDVGNNPSSGIVCAYMDGAVIDGVTVINPLSFNLGIGQSQNVTVRGFKCFSSCGASDGINIKASRQVTVEDCFVRANDDAVSIYATSVGYLGGSSDVAIRNSTLITDAAHNIMMGIHGQEYGNEVIERVAVQNVDMVDSKSQSPDYQGVMAVNAGNDVTVRDVEFRDIRVEDIRHNQLLNLRVCYNPAYNKSPGRGVENIRFQDIRYTGESLLPSILKGYDGERTVRNILFSGVTVNGTKLSGDNDWIDKQAHVSDVRYN